jgi:histidyl-tRNA synthetase
MANLKALRGVKDILPEQTPLWQAVEAQARKIFSLYGFEEIRLPILENAQLFQRSIGQATDIVQKEMYIFEDKDGETVALRPEATASVVRAYLENNLTQFNLVKLYYLGPMFRRERPQAGRLRQFHHIGIEALGSGSALLDAEVISLLVHLVESLGLANYTLKINSLGCATDRNHFAQALKDELKKAKDKLCPDCQARLARNVLRVFDCKKEECRKISQRLPAIGKFLCADCASHFQEVKNYLQLLKINYEEAPRLVRGLDYYTKTVFEMTHAHLGAQDALAAGGRYDNLVKELGGPDKPAIGFAIGVERLLLALGNALGIQGNASGALFLAALGENAQQKAFALAASLRKKGIACAMEYGEKNLKAQMKSADKGKFAYVAILGENELKSGQVLLREMETGNQENIDLEKFVTEITQRIQKA